MQIIIPDILAKIRAPAAAPVLGMFEVSEKGRAIATPSRTPSEVLRDLIAGGCESDAIHFLSYALPRREAVWWACLCARETLPRPPSAAEVTALEAAETWVFQPTDDNRRSAMAAAEDSGFDSPASWSAVAAFWSGGSMAPADQPVVPPGETLCGKAVSGAILLASVREDAGAAPLRMKEFLAWGIDIAGGGRGKPPPAG